MSQPRRVAWVTGGGTGIGCALAQALSQKNYHVAISGRRAEVLAETAASLSRQQTVAAAFPCDVTDAAAVQQTVEAIQQRWGPVDLLINNAGVNAHHSLQDATAEEFETHFRINCLGPLYCTKAVLPSMRQRHTGAIVNISSVLGQWASCNSAAYSVSKYALAGLTDVLQQDLVGSGIHVLGVYPGYIRTAMTEPFVQPGSWKRHFGKTPDALAQAILQALERRRPELHYPFYVPWVIRLHRWVPVWMNRLARRARP